MITPPRAARTLRLLAAVSILVFVGSVSAFAANGEEKVKLTREGQIAAQLAVLTKEDFSYTSGWKGGTVKPDPPSSSHCPKPGSKPLTMIANGDVKSDFQYPGLRVTSEATVFATEAMVRADWQRSVGPQVLSCLRKAIAQSPDPHGRIVSVKPLSFPRVATYTQAIRVAMVIKAKGRTVPMVDDVIMFGSGRTESMLTMIAPPGPRLAAFEVHLVQLMVRRISL